MSSPKLLRKRLAFALIACCSIAVSQAATVNVHPGNDIATIVAENPAGTTFVIYPGTYRLQKSIVPKNGDKFIGQTACAPPKTPCPAILTGSVVIGPLAKFNGSNYEVTNQRQQGPSAVVYGTEILCDPGWPGCIYPEDLFFDGVPYQHLKSNTLPAIGPHQWWFDYTHHIIYFHDNPSGHRVETSVLDGAFVGPANNVTIQYLTVKEFATMYPLAAIGQTESSPLTQGTDWTVQNCEMALNHGFGVRVGYRIHILNNYIHDNGQTGIGGGLGTIKIPVTQSVNSGILIQGNTINHNDYAHFNPDFGAGGIKIGSTSGVTIRGNIIQHNEGAGIHFDDYSSNQLIDGNTITDTVDSDGIANEMGVGTSIYRNNIVLRNGNHVIDNYFNAQIASHASTGVNAYCNVVEVPAGKAEGGWFVSTANRGYNQYPPYEYLVTTGNSFHHNTVIWDDGANGMVGFWQHDAVRQPNFWTDNPRPDHNEYHGSKGILVYDNNNSQLNNRKTFPQFQNADADVHGTSDTNNTSGFPVVKIMSPPDQSSFTTSVTLKSTASDNSGINRVEFYADWKLVATVPGPPYNFTWKNPAKGWHTLAAMAYSNKGIRNCFAISLQKQ